MMFRGMKIYTVHVNPEAPDARETPVFVREGFNIYAFLFHFLWAFYHRLWMAGFLILMAIVSLNMLVKLHILSQPGMGVIQLALMVIIGFHAHDWRRAKLSRQGYITTDIATGGNLLTAEQRYFDRYFSTAQ